MTKKQFSMTSTQIAKVVGTVASPLIVVSELIKNAVDASAENIDIFYDREQKIIAVENDHKGFSIKEIEELSTPGVSLKKVGNNVKNEYDMFLTGSKGLGLLSVFLLCDEADIITAPPDQKIHKVILNKNRGTVEDNVTKQRFEKHFSKVVLKKVNPETIDFLSSAGEVKKLRHICSYLYKSQAVHFPKMLLHISGQETQEINFSCDFPPMLYDVQFYFSKDSGELHFQCNSPGKQINNDSIVLKNFDTNSLQEIMLNNYGIKTTIPTRANDFVPVNFEGVPSFEGRVLGYEKESAGALLKTYGAGVNVYVNDFALYNYLAEENDWLGLADFSQRKKVTRLKPHNVFGFVNFPDFDENTERLKISNERADFIQDPTYSKLMYLLKGVVMFTIINIDVADKNPKYKQTPNAVPSQSGENNTTHIEEDSNAYSPKNAYKPKRNIRKHLEFTKDEGEIINNLRGTNKLGNKIYNVVFELSELDLQVHRYSIAFLYRTLIESSTIYLSQYQPKVVNDNASLETSVTNALNYFANNPKKVGLSSHTIGTWRETVSKRKLIDTLNEYVHHELPVDAHFLQETWNTMNGYVIACLKTTDNGPK
jgi:hypothetical protein